MNPVHTEEEEKLHRGTLSRQVFLDLLPQSIITLWISSLVGTVIESGIPQETCIPMGLWGQFQWRLTERWRSSHGEWYFFSGSPEIERSQGKVVLLCLSNSTACRWMCLHSCFNYCCCYHPLLANEPNSFNLPIKTNEFSRNSLGLYCQSGTADIWALWTEQILCSQSFLYENHCCTTHPILCKPI